MNKGILWTVAILLILGAGVGVWYWQSQSDSSNNANTTNTSSNSQNIDLTVNVQKSIGPIYIWGVEPDKGSTAGGQEITLRGDNILQGAKVLFNDVQSGTVTFVSNQELRIVTPKGDVGIARIKVVNPDGLSSELQNGFTYE